MLGIDINGLRSQGKDVRMANVMAVKALANIVKTSLGPQGLDKMMVDEIGDVTVTNDGATILKQMEVEHPAAKVLVQLSQLQDKEVGDGTTSVVILAAELLTKAYELIRNKVHPSSIISGYKKAMKESVKFIQKTLTVKTEDLGEEGLRNVAKTSMSSKLIGPEHDLFAKMCVKAVQHVRLSTGKVPIKNINISMAHGKSTLDSEFFDGYVLRMSRVSQQMPIRVDNPVIACLDFNLNKFRLAMGVQVLVNDPKNLEKIRKREMDILKERLDLIIGAGVNVIFTTMAIDDCASKYLVTKGIMGLRRVDKHELRRISKSTGATIVKTLANNDGTESFDASLTGKAKAIYEKNLGDVDFIFLESPANTKNRVCSLVLRGANEYMLEEVDRSIHDSLCALKRTLESGSVVAGGGCVESALSVYLDKFSNEKGGKDQIPIFEFSEALLVIPKQLSNNAAKDATELTAKLNCIHNLAQDNSGDEKFSKFNFSGLDLKEGKIRNNLEAGVLEPAISKIKSLKFATEAAITILRIDDMIRIAPEKEDIPDRH
jgi:T-complex protein 1 subunit alpha